MSVEPGQLRMMSDGTLVRVDAVGPEHMPGGQWKIHLSIVPRHGIIQRSYGTVASYPLLRDAKRAVAEASQNARRAAVHPCPICGRRCR